jgi:hypothetical protein
VTSALLSSDAWQTLPPYAFLNPNKTAMLVDEFRFSGHFGIIGGIGLSQIDIMMGGVPLTNGLVPISSLFHLWDTDLAANNTSVNALNVFPAGVPGVMEQTDLATTWHLERPLYVPYGTTFQIRLNMDQTWETFDQWAFSMHGRSCPNDAPRPDSIWVPWATGFSIPQDSALLSFVCEDNAMVNSHESPLYLEHLQGFDSFVPGGSEPTAPIYFDGFTIQVTSSSNLAIIRDPTPFQLVFPSDRLIFPVKAVLDPHEFLRVQLDAPVSLKNTGVGMVGFRQIPTPFAPGE